MKYLQMFFKHFREGFIEGLYFFILAILPAAFIISILIGWTMTGPDCPGMDPSYLGWCK